MTTTRTLTIMFTDIVSSTELFRGLAEERVVEVLQTHFATMQRLVDHHGGQVVKTLGDGVMARFTAATSAIECAVGMQRATAVSPLDGRPRLSIRVGLSSGDVRIDEDDCHGVAVVEASRICNHASSGQILTTDTTRLLTLGYHDLVAQGPVTLKGLESPAQHGKSAGRRKRPRRSGRFCATTQCLSVKASREC